MKKQMHRRYTTEEWIILAKERWGEKYDYSRVVYVTKDVEVIIGCPECGFKPIKPSTHMVKKDSNNGCPFCGKKKEKQRWLELNKNKRKTQKEVIKQFIEKHGERFDYSKVRYRGAHKKVTIVCKVKGHNPDRNGEFDIIPNSHIEGDGGCPDCFKILKTNDLTGYKPPGSKLTVLGLVLDKKKYGITDGDSYWKVQCACGREPHFVGGPELKKVKACNVCAQRDRLKRREKKFWNKIKNKTYGRLTIKRDWGTNRHSARRVLSSCQCGRNHITLFNSIANGHTLSCGCLPKGQDNFLYFLKNDEYANSDCYFYLADINDDFIKPGITNDLEERKNSGEYRDYYFVSPLLTRCEAWVIEQSVLFNSMRAYVFEYPKKYRDRNGLTEYRRKEIYSISFYQEKYFSCFEKIHKDGWDQLYLSEFSPEGENIKNIIEELFD